MSDEIQNELEFSENGINTNDDTTDNGESLEKKVKDDISNFLETGSGESNDRKMKKNKRVIVLETNPHNKLKR